MEFFIEWDMLFSCVTFSHFNFFHWSLFISLTMKQQQQQKGWKNIIHHKHFDSMHILLASVICVWKYHRTTSNSLNVSIANLNSISKQQQMRQQHHAEMLCIWFFHWCYVSAYNLSIFSYSAVECRQSTFSNWWRYSDEMCNLFLAKEKMK